MSYEEQKRQMEYASLRPERRHANKWAGRLLLIGSIISVLPVTGVYVYRLSSMYLADNFGQISYVLLSTFMGGVCTAVAAYLFLSHKARPAVAILALIIGIATMVLCFQFWIHAGIIKL